MSQIIQFAILGMATGAMYSLSALGLVVTNRASNVVNLAQASVGMFGTFVFWDLNQNHGVGYPVAAACGIAASAALSGLIQQAVMRPLRAAAPVTRMVATLGVLTVVEQAAGHIWSNQTVLVPSELPTSPVSVLGASVGADKLIILAVAAVLTAGLGVVTRYTNFGRATSAAAENPRSLAALGYSPQAIGLGNWLIGGALAGVAGILLAPILTLQTDQYTLLILPTLAAAVVGRLESLPMTFAGGLILGIAQSEISRYVSQPGWSDAAPFLLVIVVLIIRGNDRSVRSRLAERLPSVGSGRVRPAVVAGWLAAGAVFSLLAGANWAAALAVTMSASIVVLSVIVVTGYSGQLSLAQYGFAAWGAWTAARFAAATGASLIPAVLIGIALTIPLGLLLGILCLRTRGVYLAIATLGFATALQALILDNPGLTGSTNGIILPKISVFGLDVNGVNQPARYAIVVLLAFALCALLVANVRRGRSGRRLLAVRANDRAAASLGIGTTGARLYAFTLASAIAATGGVLAAFQGTVVTFLDYSPLQSIQVISQSVVGGVGWLAGAPNGGLLQPGSLAGALLAEAGPSWAGYLPAAGGILVIITVLVMPDGLAPQQLRDLRRAGNLLRVKPPGQPPAAPDPGTDQTRARGHSTLQVCGVTVAFGRHTILTDVTLTAKPGKITGLIGPNGAGKTTLIDAVTGYVPIRAGRVLAAGHRISGQSPARIARTGVTRSFQSLELFEDMTILDNIKVASEKHDPLVYLLDLAWPRHSPLTPAAAAAIRDFSLHDDLPKKPADVSFGTRRLVAIARAVATGANILLLDEPATGLNDQEAAELGTLLRTLADTWGVAILLIEHNVQMITDICDDVYVLNFGQVISHGPPARVRDDPAVINAYLGNTTGTTASTTPPTRSAAG
jgi:ABC-type branched-subunit amino acid transport system ATPase component/branched-subunit amino acid ABC-type transport system permease component